MDSVNWFSFIFLVFEKLIDLSNALYNFLFYELELLGLSVSLWQVLGGTAIVVLLTARILKLVVPLL